MKFNAHLTAFTDGQVRQVEVPNMECSGTTNSILENIYLYGQNEVSPMENRRSVSPGDAIEYHGKFYMILLVGFTEITKNNLEEFKKLSLPNKIKYLMEMENKSEKI